MSSFEFKLKSEATNLFQWVYVQKNLKATKETVY